MAKSSNLSKTAIWILLGLLILGLAGFGATNLSGTVRTIGTAGNSPISVDEYARQLQQEIRAVQMQTGQALPFAQAQQMGLDRAVLQRLVTRRSLDHEATQLGFSVGDEELRNRILQIQGFQGIDGSFDRESYRFALEQAGLSEAQFETQLREEVARTIVQGAVLAGVTMPDTYVDTLVKFIGEERSFTWSLVGADALAEPVTAPDDATLEAHYEANIEAYTLPETKEITYAWLTPDALVDEVELDEATLREAYEQRADEFNRPERRLVERLAFLDQASAEAAAATLASGEKTFEDLVEERGLSLSDVDLGDVTRADLEDAGDAVFAAEVGEVVGPLPSSLGAALFRVNASLAAQITPFDDAVEELRPQLANDRAIRLVEAQADGFEDLLAGGATLEELAAETDMEVGTISWSVESSEGIAAYEAFRDSAAALTTEDFPQIELLDDGGIFAMRLDSVLPPRPAPFEDVRDEVLADWEAKETSARLVAQLEAASAQVATDDVFEELELDRIVEENLLRSDFVPGTPRGFLETVFEMEPGELRVLSGDAAAIVVRLDAVSPPSEDGDLTTLRRQLAEQASQALSENLFQTYAADVVRRADPQINQQALQAVHVNFP